MPGPSCRSTDQPIRDPTPTFVDDVAHDLDDTITSHLRDSCVRVSSRVRAPQRLDLEHVDLRLVDPFIPPRPPSFALSMALRCCHCSW